jgi:hypothetical protein
VAKVTVYLPDELYQRVQEFGVPISPTSQKALEQEVALKSAVAGGMERIEMEMHDQDQRTWTVAFRGRWLVPPGSATKERRNPSIRFGVAITAKGMFLIHWFAVDDSIAPGYYIYPSLGMAFQEWDENAEPDNEYQRTWPRDIILAAAEELGTNLVVELDI